MIHLIIYGYSTHVCGQFSSGGKLFSLFKVQTLECITVETNVIQNIINGTVFQYKPFIKTVYQLFSNKKVNVLGDILTLSSVHLWIFVCPPYISLLKILTSLSHQYLQDLYVTLLYRKYLTWYSYVQLNEHWHILFYRKDLGQEYSCQQKLNHENNY